MIGIVFFGSGEFADIILKGIIADSNYRVLAVVSQPARPVGREHKIAETPVSLTARSRNIKLYQPESLADFDIPEIHGSDLGVVAQYGHIIPERIISAPKHKTINLHASLLPAYRGASPIQSALMNGETESGVTLMLMDHKMDHGPIIGAEKIFIGSAETQDEIFKKMSVVARKLFLRLAPKWIAGIISAIPQDHSKATYCKTLTKEDGRVNFNKSASEIFNQWRAMTPWPGIWAEIGGKRIKLAKIEVSERQISEPGMIVITDDKIFIGCNDKSSIRAVELQKEGKKIQLAADFINGNRNISGAKFND